MTFALPLGIDHVHCYFLRSSGGGWILVDTSLGFDDPEAAWRPVLDALDAPVESILVTHAHPDHIGGSADVAALTGATVYEGRIDNGYARAVWGPSHGEGQFDDYLRLHGTPEELLGSPGIGARVRIADDPVLLDEGDELDGWRVSVLPGHADGHVVLDRDGVLVAGDTVLGRISPHVGLYPAGRPDPLADFLASLERIGALAPRLALTGHGPLLDDAAGRAREIAVHHADRLELTVAALDREPRTGYDISRRLFGHVPLGQRRFALTETLAHLERLVRLGRARRVEGLPVRFGT